MTKTLKFRIATPDRVILETEVERVTCATQLGEVTILPDHIPLVANLMPGEMTIVEKAGPRYLAVTGGFLEVRPGNEVVILADAAEHVEEIDIKRAEEARERARKRMTEEVKDAESFAEAQAALERSLARLRVGKRKYRDVGRRAPGSPEKP
ncbi:MAG: ATP synthase F1 subunit epsilon [Candidatus Doudnabacteria bacterium RIFCSPHIGHO2_01_52_17]|uniref:ATP synthase epsilon chain n=1 Tax=Candidatus Doudnabacteria bacterium RIFCSPHIGHO2_01_52_17 TaxID=1817820 RepID=A0A1F5NFP1_9BACT|nr:MAG: ATP synthase epsilon chain [Parcubacteria group bacterium GW2011_GWA2_52_8]OGE76445.1 MAG: ATP synthase F1 subunit epsilon [Candidatus Doudnabacteria bacterium RIFCSPHIGHO2_01_52_17]